MLKPPPVPLFRLALLAMSAHKGQRFKSPAQRASRPCLEANQMSILTVLKSPSTAISRTRPTKELALMAMRVKELAIGTRFQERAETCAQEATSAKGVSGTFALQAPTAMRDSRAPWLDSALPATIAQVTDLTSEPTWKDQEPSQPTTVRCASQLSSARLE